MWNTTLIFSNKNHGLHKKLLIEQKKNFFSVDHVKIIELHVYTHDVTCNLSRWNNEGNDISKKDQ